MPASFLYVAQGRIFLKDPNQPARQIESVFAQKMVDRAEQIRQRNSWKTQGFGARFMSGGGVPWAQDGDDQPDIPVVINAVSRGAHEGEILYSLASRDIGGVFSIDSSGQNERRLLHTADFRISELCANPALDRIACVIRTKAGSHIAVMRGDGGELSDVTQGDALDASPVWVPGATKELVYQSAGIARNADGMAVGASPSQIMKVNIESGASEVLLGDAKFDYLDPKIDAAGNLYCIRKPHVPLTPRFNPLRAIWELILLPARLLYALFQFMNFFTMRYTGKTLVSSGNMRQGQLDPRQVLIMQNLMHARGNGYVFAPNKRQWNVSRSWTLVRKASNGALESIASGTLTFDLCADGSVLYTNGNRIFGRTPNGEAKELVKDQFISQVVTLE